MNASLRSPIVLAILLGITLARISEAQAYKEVINAGTPAVYPYGAFVADTSGNLYATFSNGGTSSCFFYGCGAIYKWDPGTHKQPAMLYSFTGSSDGAGPESHLAIDAQGNLYGAATYAGNLSDCNGQGCGTIFEVSPSSSGSWTETTLYAFGGGDDGLTPEAVTLDSHGNIFGVTKDGGGYSCPGGQQCGIAFELSPNSSGDWTKTTLHAFTGGTDGGIPSGPLLIDANGNLFGTTDLGGAITTVCTEGCGTVYELSPSSSGTWTFTTINTFDFTHGAGPLGTLAIDAAHNLYGATYDGARTYSYCPGGCGVVFELSPTESGWKQSLLHSFSGPDGGNPQDGVIIDAAGNVYGAATTGGGSTDCTSGHQTGCGAIFELSPASGGHWTFDRLYSFHGLDGWYPGTNPLINSAGELFGTTEEGDTGFGNLYELAPAH